MSIGNHIPRSDPGVVGERSRIHQIDRVFIHTDMHAREYPRLAGAGRGWGRKQITVVVAELCQDSSDKRVDIRGLPGMTCLYEGLTAHGWPVDRGRPVGPVFDEVEGRAEEGAGIGLGQRRGGQQERHRATEPQGAPRYGRL